MIKMVLSAFAALTVMFAAPASAQVSPPAQVNLFTVTMGKIVNGQVPMTLNNQTVVVTMAGCDTTWATGQAFYVLSVTGIPPVVVRKDLLDYAWDKTGGDWDVAFTALVDAKQVCIIAPVK